MNDTLIGRAAPDDDATRDLLDALLEAGPENPAWSQLDRLVRRSADAVGRSNNPPSPDGDRWTRAELEDLAQSFWAAGNVEKVIVGASDDLRRRVITALSLEFIVKATGVTSMTYAQAACVPCPGVTAWNAQLAINSPSPKPLPPPDSERASAPKN